MEIRRFDRHAHMSKETREAILDCISNLYEFKIGVSCFNVTNYLYGFFDGYDYSELVPKEECMKAIKDKNPVVYQKIMDICQEVSQYPVGITQV